MADTTTTTTAKPKKAAAAKKEKQCTLLVSKSIGDNFKTRLVGKTVKFTDEETGEKSSRVEQVAPQVSSDLAVPLDEKIVHFLREYPLELSKFNYTPQNEAFVQILRTKAEAILAEVADELAVAFTPQQRRRILFNVCNLASGAVELAVDNLFNVITVYARNVMPYLDYAEAMLLQPMKSGLRTPTQEDTLFDQVFSKRAAKKAAAEVAAEEEEAAPPPPAPKKKKAAAPKAKAAPAPKAKTKRPAEEEEEDDASAAPAPAPKKKAKTASPKAKTDVSASPKAKAAASPTKTKPAVRAPPRPPMIQRVFDDEFIDINPATEDDDYSSTPTTVPPPPPPSRAFEGGLDGSGGGEGYYESESDEAETEADAAYD